MEKLFNLYEKTTYLKVQIGVLENELLVEVSVDGWPYYHLPKWISSNFTLELNHFVLGSDITGCKETNLNLMEKCIFERILKFEEQIDIRSYFLNKIREGYPNCISFKGNQFLPSQTHPNFV